MTQNRTVTLSRCHALQSQSVKNANAHFALFVPFECLGDFFCRKYLFATCWHSECCTMHTNTLQRQCFCMQKWPFCVQRSPLCIPLA